MDRKKLDEDWVQRSAELQREEELHALEAEHAEELARVHEQQELERKEARDKGFSSAVGVSLFVLGIVIAIAAGSAGSTGSVWIGIGIGAVGLLLAGRGIVGDET